MDSIDNISLSMLFQSLKYVENDILSLMENSNKLTEKIRLQEKRLEKIEQLLGENK
jgi:hypothetical protein